MRNFTLVIIATIFIQNLQADSFEKNCVECHFAKQQLEIFISRYTIKYSSETRIKDAIYNYLKNPTQKSSVMPQGFLNRFGIKKPSQLSDSELKNSIDEYYRKYNFKDRIR